MLQKTHIQSILKINGINQDSTEEEVRAVLSSASYTEDEINAAVSMLKSGVEEPSLSKLDGLHKVFRSSDTLKPSEISDLLSIEVGVNELNTTRTSRATDLNEPIVFTFATVLISAVGLIVAMYIYNIDILHIAEKAFGGV